MPFKIAPFIFLTLSFLNVRAQIDSTNLPIVIIDTEGRIIRDDPKTMVKMKIINKGAGKFNKPTDLPNEFDGLIGIELRGSSSQMFPKKPFGFEVWDKDTNDIKVGFFGFPKESDWILYPSYNEKSFMHNTLTMGVARKMGMYASRTKYVEVILNGSYEGIYVFMEKVKRDKDRVNITKLDEKATSGDDITGGYIIKLDKVTGTNLGSWRSGYSNPGNTSNFSNFYYDAPKEITEPQKKYIRDYVGKFEDVMFSKNFADPVEGYPKYIDVRSFINMFIINEFSRNIDAYRISTYLFKDKDSKGGKLTMGPPWDYDIAFGNCEYAQGTRYDIFAFRYNQIAPDDSWLVPFWWERFMSDPEFVGAMRTQYFKFREKGNVLDLAEINKEIDAMSAEISEAQKRNFKRWPILGQYVWPNPQPIPSSWEMEVLELKSWIKNRLEWLDRNLPAQYTALENSPGKLEVTAYPNPFLDTISLKFTSSGDGMSKVEFFDLQGKALYHTDLETVTGHNIFNIRVSGHFETGGSHIMKITTPTGESVTKKMIRVP